MTDLNKMSRRDFLGLAGKAGLSMLIASGVGSDFGLAQAAEASLAKGEAAHLKRPLYTLKINTMAACFEIKVNDIPLHAERMGAETAVEMPINHLLLNGENSLQVVISPSKEDGEFVDHTQTTFEIYCRDAKESRRNRKLVASAHFPDYLGNKKLKKSAIHSTTEFQASLTSEAPVWSGAPVLTLNEQTVNAALAVYKKYFHALKSKNIEAIFNLTKLKDKAYADSYYQSLDTHLEGLRESLKEELADPANELIDFDKQVKTPELHASGRLITILNQDKRSPLQFYNSDTGITTSYKIYLCSMDGGFAIVL